MQEFEPLGHQFCNEKIYTGGVATRPSKAGDKTKLDRVFIDAEHDRDRHGHGFRRERTACVSGRSDHRHATANQLRHQRRQAIILSFQPVVIDRHVLAIGVAGFTKPFAERGSISRQSVGRSRA
jgi:hypothetical protein